MYEKFDPLIDFVFKRIFGDENNKDILIDFLNAELKYDRPIENLDILNPQIDKSTLDDKLSILDIRAKLSGGEQVNIEVQLTNAHNIEKRSLFYWSKLYTGQLAEGVKYNELKKTICINILNFNYLPCDSFQSVFHLIEDKSLVRFTDDLEIHIIEMPKFAKSEIKFDDKLNSWLLFLKDPNNKDLEVIMKKEKNIERAMTVLESISRSKEERFLYEQRIRAIRDYESGLEVERMLGVNEGIQKGRLEGKLEGRLEGKLEGRLEGRLEGVCATAENMKKLGVDISTIARYTGLSEEEIKKL